MRCRRFLLPSVIIPLFAFAAGCNYVHFGRLDRLRHDPALAAENSDLRIEKKLLKEELEIARKEREILSAAIERAPAGSDDLAARLTATNQDLAALRESYARLKTEREQLKATPVVKRLFSPASTPPNQQITGLKDQLDKTEEKLADTLRTQVELQGENSRLRAELEQAHAENATLASKVEQLTAESTSARTALAQLHPAAPPQPEAPAETAAAPEQPPAKKNPGPAPVNEPAFSLSSARESSADAARELAATLQSGTLSAQTSAVAALSIHPAKLLPSAPTPDEPAPAIIPAARTYTVRDGDSLEKIAEQLYGRRDRWILLYAANNALLSEGRPLKAGMTLQVPTE